ncbi:MAG: MBL fold metallo-hydrolase [Candidatus Delongbacteria bacterium]
MSLRACVLASGSAGNAVLVRGGQGALLVDAGLGLRDLGRRLAAVECDPDELAGILLTHEHSDHVGCAPSLARRLGIPVWCSRGTAAATERYWTDVTRPLPVRAGEVFEVAGLRVEAWACSHDAREPLQFGVEEGPARLAVCTDLGCVTDVVRESLRRRHLLILESNHDQGLLLKGSYPAFLKRRILGDRGHLSNQQCADVLCHVAGPELRHVILGHLSRENNRPELALEAAGRALESSTHGSIRLDCARQDQVGDWLDVFSGQTC